MTLLTSEMISLTAPGCTLMRLSSSSEARTAAASAHRADELDGAAAADDEVAEAAAEGEVADEVLPDPHPASSARPHTARASFHRAVPAAIPGFMS